MKCSHCGHFGSDVHKYSSYVGGIGWVPHIQCDNMVDCWKRWDEKNLVCMTTPEYIGKALEIFNKGVELGKGIGREA
jgi:hypothetical protein